MIITIANNKGGVGKTTATCNLAHALAKTGKKILIVDNDTQCNSTTLLMTKKFRVRDSLYELLSPEENVPVEKCIYPTPYANLYCLPNIPETSGLEPDIIEDKSGNLLMALRKLVRDHALKNFDYTFIDTPPNLGSFVLAALYASDFVIVPIAARSTFSLEGLVRALKLIERIKNSKNKDLKFLRLLINEIDRRTSSSSACIQHVSTSFDEGMFFRTVVPVNATFHTAEGNNQTIIAHNYSSAGSKAYRSLANEFIEISHNLAPPSPSIVSGDGSLLLDNSNQDTTPKMQGA